MPPRTPTTGRFGGNVRDSQSCHVRAMVAASHAAATTRTITSVAGKRSTRRAAESRPAVRHEGAATRVVTGTFCRLERRRRDRQLWMLDATVDLEDLAGDP